MEKDEMIAIKAGFLIKSPNSGSVSGLGSVVLVLEFESEIGL